MTYNDARAITRNIEAWLRNLQDEVRCIKENTDDLALISRLERMEVVLGRIFLHLQPLGNIRAPIPKIDRRKAQLDRLEP